MRRHVLHTQRPKLRTQVITADIPGSLRSLSMDKSLNSVMRKLLLIIILTDLCNLVLFGQGEIDKQQKIFYRNEISFGLLLNSDGFGLSYREAQRVDYLNKRIFEIEAGTLKNPKEYKESNPLYETPGTFIYGKINSAFYLRGSYGHQGELYRKADLGGVAIRYFFSGGPIFAIYKPIYYKILHQVSQNEFELIDGKFEPGVTQPYDIYSRASFTKGFNEIKFIPGLFVKGGFNFEYSKQDKIIHAIELGASLSAFPKKIPIMAMTSNKAVFLSLFISYRFGVIIDPLNPETNKLSYILGRKRSAPSKE